MVKLILKTYFLKKHGQHCGQHLFFRFNCARCFNAMVNHFECQSSSYMQDTGLTPLSYVNKAEDKSYQDVIKEKYHRF